MRLRTIVTSYAPNAQVLPDFERLMRRFYPFTYEIDVAPKGERKSEQLIRILDAMRDDYFVLLEDDFYLVSEVRNDGDELSSPIEYAAWCAEKYAVDRFSLQSKNHYRVTDWKQWGEAKFVYRADDRVPCIVSLEASVWKKSFLRELVGKGLMDNDIEHSASNRVRGKNYLVLAFNEPVISYVDAMIGGEPRARIVDGEMEVLKQAGDGSDKWERNGVILS